MLENYFWEKNAGNLLSMKDKQKIGDKQRREIIAVVVDFIVGSYGFEVTFLEKCIIAFATVTLFPALKYKGSKDGTVSILFHEHTFDNYS